MRGGYPRKMVVWISDLRGQRRAWYLVTMVIPNLKRPIWESYRHEMKGELRVTYSKKVVSIGIPNVAHYRNVYYRGGYSRSFVYPVIWGAVDGSLGSSSQH